MLLSALCCDQIFVSMKLATTQDLICRAHQVCEDSDVIDLRVCPAKKLGHQDGYEFFAGRKLVTVFSAPNYMDAFDNPGAMAKLMEEILPGINYQAQLAKYRIAEPSTGGF